MHPHLVFDRIRKGWIGWAAIPLLALLAAPATAETPAPTDAPASDWDVSFAPYLWVSDLKVDASYQDLSVTIEPHLADLLSSIELGFMGTLDVYHRPSKFSFNVDAFWLRLATEAEVGPFDLGAGPFSFTSPGFQRQVGPIQIATPQGPVSLGPFNVDTGPVNLSVPRVEFPIGPFEIEQKMTQSAVRASVGYRVLDLPLAELFGGAAADAPRRIRADLYAGGRLWYVKARAEVKYPAIEVPGLQINPSLVAYPKLDLGSVQLPGVTFAGGKITEETSTWWVDPLVGARVAVELRRPLSFVVNGNIGGFGIGSASEFSWEVMGAFTWSLGDNLTAALGYRALDLRKANGDLEIDMLMHGPILGLIYHFR